MKLRNLVLATMPLLFSCKDITQPNPRLLNLKDYTCADESCSTFGVELPKNGIRPLRFISLASYPGKQDYYWELTWTDTITDATGRRVPIPQKNWFEFSGEEDYSAISFNFTKAPPVEYRLLVRVREDSIVSRWKPR